MAATDSRPPADRGDISGGGVRSAPVADIRVHRRAAAPLPTWARGLVIAVSLGVFGAWLAFTPPGLLDKFDAIGYAICHRIASHSFFAYGRQLPLCVRCTGTYLGVLLGFVTPWFWGRGRAVKFPPPAVMITLLGFTALMAVDGINSYLSFFEYAPHLYRPQHWLRLVTGTLNGLMLSNIILPVLNGTIWLNWEPRPVIANMWELGRLVLIALAADVLVLTQWEPVLFVVGILSILAVIAALMSIHMVVLLSASFGLWRIRSQADMIWPAILAFAMAIAQIGVIDAIRYAATGTWAGFPIP